MVGVYEQFDEGLYSNDPLKFKDTKRYEDRLRKSKQATGLTDAILSVQGTISGIPVVLVVMEYSFIGGSMGVVVGETITRAVERALEAAHAAHHHFSLRWSPHARRSHLLDADGEGHRGFGSARSRRRFPIFPY